MIDPPPNPAAGLPLLETKYYLPRRRPGLVSRPRLVARLRSRGQLTELRAADLRLVAAGMRNREIAAHLFISPSTVKRHVAHAYGKLDVDHRTAAVARANDLKLL